MVLSTTSTAYWCTTRLAVAVLCAIPLFASAQLEYTDVAAPSDNQAMDQNAVAADDDAGFAAPADNAVAEAEEVAAQEADAASPPATANLVALHQTRNVSVPAAASAAPEVNATPTLSPEEKARDDLKKGHLAAAVAAKAASTAKSVAERSVRMTHEAQETLAHAQDAIHHARVDTIGLSDEQRNALKDAEHHLMDGISNVHPDAVYIAHASAQLGEPNYIEAARGKRVTITHIARKREEKEEERRKKLEVKLSKLEDNGTQTHHSFVGQKREKNEVDQVKEALHALRERLEASKSKLHADDVEEFEVQLQELEAMVGQVEPSNGSNDQLKAELVRLEEAMTKLEDSTAYQHGELEFKIPEKKEEEEPEAPKPEKGKLTYRVPPVEEPEPEVKRPVEGLRTLEAGSPASGLLQQQRVVPSLDNKGSIDIDTEMPYGELEPFGREDTAQELTEASIRESDAMVDQLERAEVSEEKRAVFRALTRLRGAAITSFDGVARSQTGNIDEYNKVHQWRESHPLHHLADEESDISKWAFPDNADF